MKGKIMTVVPKENLILTICSLLLYVQSLQHSKFSMYRKYTLPFTIYLLSYMVTGIAIIFMFIFIIDEDYFFYLIFIYITGLLIRIFGKFIYAKKDKNMKMYEDVISQVKDIAFFLGIGGAFLGAFFVILEILYMFYH